jgi:hypothetical protein
VTRTLAALLLLHPACVVHYTIGDATDTTAATPEATCPDGQPCEPTSTSTNTSTDHDTQQTTAPPCDCDPALERCTDASCTCRPGLTLCDATCVDLRADPAHCGDCERGCDGGVCQTSACREACSGDLTDCDGACVALKTDSLHCGNCATLCAPDEVCLAGTCRPYQPADDCDACPCPACGDGQTCCPSSFLAAPVCVAGPCGGDGDGDGDES